jgi:hypothetical protein
LNEKYDEDGRWVIDTRLAIVDKERINKQFGYEIEKWRQ